MSTPLTPGLCVLRLPTDHYNEPDLWLRRPCKVVYPVSTGSWTGRRTGFGVEGFTDTNTTFVKRLQTKTVLIKIVKISNHFYVGVMKLQSRIK